MKHGKNCGFFAPQKSIRWRSELVFGLKESILAQLSPWSAKWHQDSLQVSENVENFSKVNEAAAAYMVIAEGLKWLTKFSAWCCWACDLTYVLDDRSCRRKITRLADSSERPTPGLSVFLLFVWASMCSVWNDTNVWNQNQWVAFVHGKCYVTINVTYTLNNNHTNCVSPSFVWLLLSVYVTLIVT